MRIFPPGAVLRPLALGTLLLAGAVPLQGCGEEQKTGEVVKEDPDVQVRNKEMEDFMNSQSKKK